MGCLGEGMTFVSYYSQKSNSELLTFQFEKQKLRKPCNSYPGTLIYPQRLIWNSFYIFQITLFAILYSTLCFWMQEICLVFNLFFPFCYSRVYSFFYFSLLLLFSCVWLFVAPWTAACQASLSFTVSWSLLKLMSIESVMPSNHLILYRPLLLLPSIFPSIRVFSSETRWERLIGKKMIFHLNFHCMWSSKFLL